MSVRLLVVVHFDLTALRRSWSNKTDSMLGHVTLAFIPLPRSLFPSCAINEIQRQETEGKPTTLPRTHTDGWTCRHQVAPRCRPSMPMNPQSASSSMHRWPFHPAWRRRLAVGGGIAFLPHEAPSSNDSHGDSRACNCEQRLKISPCGAQIDN
jgi:hypothetical protein